VGDTRDHDRAHDGGPCSGWYLAFTSVLDRGEVERARKLLDAVFAARELLPAEYRCHVSGWMAFAVARYDADVDRAHEIVSAVPDWSRAEWLWYLATAAASLAAGRPHVALAICDQLPAPQGNGFALMVSDQEAALRAAAAAALERPKRHPRR
jgi:hypothetical protein